MTTPISITVIDAFTDQPFAGNPAAVCLLDRPAPDEWMAKVAREMNLSETAFLHREGNGYRLRWFTPRVEIELCGHATLAAAHFLWTGGHLAETEPARFRSMSGPLTARRSTDGGIVLDFPALSCTRTHLMVGLAEAVGFPEEAITGHARSDFDWLLEVADEESVDMVAIDQPALIDMPIRGVIVTAPSKRTGIDFVSRFFAPGAGVPEDPVTGSAHCVLGPYWAKRLGRTELVGYQASERGGMVRVRLVGDDRVELIGNAVTMLRGTLLHGPGAVSAG